MVLIERFFFLGSGVFFAFGFASLWAKSCCVITLPRNWPVQARRTHMINAKQVLPFRTRTIKFDFEIIRKKLICFLPEISRRQKRSHPLPLADFGDFLPEILFLAPRHRHPWIQINVRRRKKALIKAGAAQWYRSWSKNLKYMITRM